MVASSSVSVAAFVCHVTSRVKGALVHEEDSMGQVRLTRSQKNCRDRHLKKQKVPAVKKNVTTGT